MQCKRFETGPAVWKVVCSKCAVTYTLPCVFFAGAALALGQIAASGPVSTPSGIWNYQPITTQGRVDWFFHNTIGPASVLGGAMSAGWGTLFNTPHEYGTHWEGFGKRYGMRFVGVSVSNALEAGLSALWGEDPRYIRASGQPFKYRVTHVIKMTFLAQNAEGETTPALARYAAIPASNFLSNAWRADSEADAEHAWVRTLLGFLGRMSSNAFDEFWPDVRQRVFHRSP